MIELEARQNSIKNLFNTFTNNDDKWKYLLQLANNNQHIDNYDDKFLVQGCSTQIYLIPEYKDDKLYFKCDSKVGGLLSLGLCIFAANLYSGLSPKEILDSDFSFFNEIGFYNGLTPTRNNGFASILAKIKYFAILNYKL